MRNLRGFDRQGGGLAAVDVGDAQLGRDRGCDHYIAGLLDEGRIAPQAGNHPPDELRALAVGQVQPAWAACMTASVLTGHKCK